MQPDDGRDIKEQLGGLWEATTPPQGWGQLRARLAEIGGAGGRPRVGRRWLAVGLPIAAALALAFGGMGAWIFELRARVSELHGNAIAQGVTNNRTGPSGAGDGREGGVRGGLLPPRPPTWGLARQGWAVYKRTLPFFEHQTRWLAMVNGDVQLGLASPGEIAVPGEPVLLNLALLPEDSGRAMTGVLAEVVLTEGSVATFAKHASMVYAVAF